MPTDPDFPHGIDMHLDFDDLTFEAVTRWARSHPEINDPRETDDQVVQRAVHWLTITALAKLLERLMPPDVM